eukprot:17968_1
MAEEKHNENIVADSSSRKVTLGNDPSSTIQSSHGITPGGNINYFSERSRSDNHHFSDNHRGFRGGFRGSGRGSYRIGGGFYGMKNRNVNLNMRRQGSGMIYASDGGQQRPFQNIWSCSYCRADNWLKDWNILGNVDPCRSCGRAGEAFVWGNDELVRRSLKVTGSCDRKRKFLDKKLVDVENYDEKANLEDLDNLQEREVFLNSEVKRAQDRVDDAEEALKRFRELLYNNIGDLNICREDIKYKKEKHGWKGNLPGVKSHLKAERKGVDPEENFKLREVRKEVGNVVTQKVKLFVWHGGIKVPFLRAKGMGLMMNYKKRSRNWLYFAREEFRILAASGGYMSGVIEECNVGIGEGNITLRMDNEEQRVWSLVKFVKYVDIISADCENVNCILDISCSVGVRIVARAMIGGNFRDRAEAHEVVAAKNATIFGEIRHVCGLKII